MASRQSWQRKGGIPMLLTCALWCGALSAAPAMASPAGAPEQAPKKTAAGQSSTPVTTQDYLVQTDDVLEISVLGEAELTKTVTVLPDGMVAYPYLGEFRVAGFTVGKIKQQVINKLKEQLRDPQVTVAVVRRRESTVSVLGRVNAPGKLAFQPGWHVLDALAESGGLAVRPEWAEATLARGGGDSEGEVIALDLVRLYSLSDAAANPVMNPGDVLIVREMDASRTQVQVIGEVVKQGQIAPPEDGSIVSTLTAMGGPTPSAALASAVIIRGEKRIAVDLTGYPDIAPKADVKLEPGDTLMVPQNKRHYVVWGAVGKPGTISYPEQGTVSVMDALTAAGGYNENSDLKNAAILRMGADGQPSSEKIDLADAIKNGKPVVAQIQPGEVLVIPAKGPRATRNTFQTVLSLLPLFNLLSR